MKKREEIHADDLLDQLNKHVEPPKITADPGRSEEEGGGPQTLEELFGHSFIRRGSGERAVTKAQPIAPQKKVDEDAPADPTKVRLDENEYDLKRIFGMSEEESAPVAEPAPPRKEQTKRRPASRYDQLTAADKKKLLINYHKRLWKVRLYIFLLGLMVAFALFWENSAVFGFGLPDFLDPARHSAVTAWLAIQLMVFGALLVPESFRRSRPGERGGVATRMYAALLILHTAYLLLWAFLMKGKPIQTFCLPVLVGGILAKLCAYGDLRREYLAFKIAFSGKEKYTLRLLEDGDADLEKEALREYMPEGSRYFAVERIRSVLGFAEEVNAGGSVKRPVRWLIPLAVAVSTLFGMVWWSNSGSFSEALLVAMGAAILCLPLSLLYVFYAPMTTLATGIRHSQSAVLGERAMDEYAPPAVVTFQDSEVFPPEQVSLVGVKVFDDADLSKVIGYASAIFCATGGALGEMFSQIVSDTGYTADMDFITVSDNGVEAAVDGELVRIGHRTFLREAGIDIPSDGRDLETDAAILYMAIAREPVARMEIAYEMDEDFENIARNLFRSGICVAIKTFDPNINREFVERRIRWGSDMPLQVVRGREKKDRILHREAAESILLSGTKRGLFETLKYCRTTRHLMQIGVVLSILSLLAAIPLYWLLLTMMGIDQVTSLNAMIYQLIWLLPMLVITKLIG